jgi:DNA-binding MarR family transcriptional regulator
LTGNPHISHDSVPVSEDAERILRALRGIVRSITIHSKRLYRDTGLTLPQVLCLRVIYNSRDEGITAAEVSRAIQLSPATVTGIIDRLENAGLVERVRESKDRRKVTLRMTDAGVERYNALPWSLQDRAIERLNQLEPEQRRAILMSLKQVLDIIEASSLDASPILTSGEDQSASLDLPIEAEAPDGEI